MKGLIFLPDFIIENEAKEKGYKYICGVDEAGRGPLAGPVCAAAVILPDGIEIAGLNDSKKLSEKKREELYEVITEKALETDTYKRINKGVEKFFNEMCNRDEENTNALGW